eukprot:m.73723 g.73723  ORF g.73723 m.73723 type:complete len:379 (+) comp17053_c0_seq1:42-1178(+)
MPVFVYTCGYTENVGFCDGKGKGINCYAYEEGSRALKLLHITPCPGPNPTYMCVDAARKTLYVSSETNSPEPHSKVFTYAMDAATGQLELRGAVSARGGGACFVHLHASGKFVLVSNYHSGSLICFRRDPDSGVLQEPAAGFFEAPLSEAVHVNAERQERPHFHQALPHPTHADLVFVPDLGCDRVRLFRVGAAGDLTQLPAAIVMPPGSGPRHLAFNRSGSVAFVTNELLSTVAVCPVQLGGPALDSVAVSVHSVLPCVPPELTGQSWTAAIRLSPDYKHVYVSNRGRDSLSVFRRSSAAHNDNSPELELTRHVADTVGGKCPRDFAFVDATTCLVSFQNSSNLFVFKVNPEDGNMESCGQGVECLTVACVLPVKLE